MRFLGFAVVTGAAMLLGACGGGSDSKPAMEETPAAEAPMAEAAPEAAMEAGAAMPITGTIHTVQMIGDDKGYRYEPAEITAKAGDGIKFVMVTGGPHNVAFDATLLSADVKAQLVANMPNQAAELMGPMMLNANEEYTLSLAGIAPGSYEFFCTPHLAMGMKGKITVTE
jgi:plastocyanin